MKIGLPYKRFTPLFSFFSFVQAIVVDTLNLQTPHNVNSAVCYDRSIQLVADDDQHGARGDRYDFTFGSGMGMGAFLNSCVGAAVSIDFSMSGGNSATMRGRILSVERNRVVLDPGSPNSTTHEVYTTLHMLEEGTNRIRRVELNQVSVDASFNSIQNKCCSSLEGGVFRAGRRDSAAAAWGGHGSCCRPAHA
jgi:hypothetical protein